MGSLGGLRSIEIVFETWALEAETVREGLEEGLGEARGRRGGGVLR